MVRARVAAICVALTAFVALMAFAPSARAQPQITERLRLQGGFISEQRPAPAERIEDVWVGAVPELRATWLTPRATVTLTYQLTGALHSFGAASEIANRVLLTSAYELGPRTALLLSAEGAQTSASNFLIQRTAADNPVALYPAAGTRFITGRLTQGLRHELTPNVMLSQESSALTMTTLAPAPPLDTFVASVGAGVERLWRNDGVGIDVRGGYALTRAAPPTPSVEVFTATAAPFWRHDWTRSLSSTVSAGATYLFSPDPNSEPLVAPYGRAMLLYTTGPTSFDLSYNVGVFPSPLTGQLLRSHQGVFHVLTPISEHHRILLGSSIGYLRATLVDLVSTANDQSFQAFYSDVDVTWQASGRVQVFGRYQVIAQLAEINALGFNPSFLRDAVIIGVQLSSESAEVTVPTRFAQRVDGADAPLRPEDQLAAAAEENGQPATYNGAAEPAATEHEDETSAGGGEVEGLPGMWRTRPSRPAGEQREQPGQQPGQRGQPGQPGPNRPRR